MVRLAALMRHGKDLRAQAGVFFVDDGVGKSVEVKQTHAVLRMRAQLLVFNEQLKYSFVLSEKASAIIRLACIP